MPESANAIIIALSSIRRASEEQGRVFKRVEKAALSHLARKGSGCSPRQVAAEANQAVRRAEAGGHDLLYSHLFDRGDRHEEENLDRYPSLRKLRHRYVKIEP